MVICSALIHTSHFCTRKNDGCILAETVKTLHIVAQSVRKALSDWYKSVLVVFRMSNCHYAIIKINVRNSKVQCLGQSCPSSVKKSKKYWIDSIPVRIRSLRIVIYRKKESLKFFLSIDMRYEVTPRKNCFNFRNTHCISMVIEVNSEVFHDDFFIVVRNRPFLFIINKLIEHQFSEINAAITAIIIERVKMPEIALRCSNLKPVCFFSWTYRWIIPARSLFHS